MLAFSGGMLLLLLLFAAAVASRNEFKPLNTFKFNVFYADDKQNIEEYVLNSIEIINNKLVKHSFQFDYDIYKVDDTNSFRMTKILCSDLYEGRLAVIGIGNSPTLDHLETVSAVLNIPFISVKWNDNYDNEPIIAKRTMQQRDDDDDDHTVLDDNYATVTDDDENEVVNRFAVNMHTPSSKIMHAVIDLADYYKWEYVTILYQETLGLEHIQDLIRVPSIKNLDKTHRTQVRQLSANMGEWIYLLKDVKLSGSSHVVVDIETKYLNDFIKHANDVGMMTAYFHFIFTTLDLSVLTYTPAANITAFQVYRPHDPPVENLLAEWNIKNTLRRKRLDSFLMSDAVLIYDTLQLLANIIIDNDLVSTLASTSFSVSCQKETTWAYGETFARFIRTSNFTALTGEVSFNQKTGERNNVFLYIVDMTRNGVDLVGYWNENKKLFNKSIHIIRSYTKEKDQVMDKLNRNLVVTTRLEDPYVMRKQLQEGQKLYGNDRYEGYCIDLLEKIAKICGFNYTIKLVEDGLYGTKVDGKWNGLVKDLIDKKADLAVAALTINYQREEAIDFTKPFLNLGISILYKRPQKKPPYLFSFLLPLSNDIWLYMIAAYLGVSFMLFVLARFSPYEWQNPHPCKPDSGIVENQFTLLNSLWFTVGSLMQQGTDINPQSPSIRLISCVWSFFTLILISSYTANLAAFLTVQRLNTPIESVEDLSKQTDIKYGSLTGGSTLDFFKESKIQTYERMWNFMSNNPDVFVNSTELGIQRVKNEAYAFLLESTMNEYARQHDCELMQVGGLLDSKGYGIGTPTGSPWRDQISNAILKLQEDGLLQFLHTKWWKEQKGALICDHADEKKKDSANELGLANVGGVFVVLVVGLCLSFVVALLEFIWKARQTADSQISVKQQIIRDCKFALCHYNKTKKSSLMHFAKLNLNNVIKIIPPEDEINSALAAAASDSMPVHASRYSLSSNASACSQMVINREPKSINTTPNRNRKTPQMQHRYLK